MPTSGRGCCAVNVASRLKKVVAMMIPPERRFSARNPHGVLIGRELQHFFTKWISAFPRQLS
jgi:hypothetical protein